MSFQKQFYCAYLGLFITKSENYLSSEYFLKLSSKMKRRNNQSVQYSLNAKLTFNVSVVGQKSAGKSSLIIRQVKDTFGKIIKTSNGFQFYSKTLKMKNDQISLQIWDTVGKSQYKSMTRNFFRQAAAIIIVYEKIDNLANEIDSLCKELQQYAHDSVKLCIVRTKTDINSIDQEQKNKLVQLTQYRFPKTIFHQGQVSSRKNQNVHQYFSQLVNKLHKCYQQEQEFRQAINGQKDSFVLSSDQLNQQPLSCKKRCC